MAADDDRDSPAAVVGAVAAGTAPLPFLAVYATLFILHGTLKPVHPADIGSGQTSELIAGLVALAIFIGASATLLWFLNSVRRWSYAAVQLAVLGGVTYLLLDDTAGGRAVSLLLVVTTLVSLVLGFAPDSWSHLGRPAPKIIGRLYRPLGPWTRQRVEV